MFARRIAGRCADPAWQEGRCRCSGQGSEDGSLAQVPCPTSHLLSRQKQCDSNAWTLQGLGHRRVRCADSSWQGLARPLLPRGAQQAQLPAEPGTDAAQIRPPCACGLYCAKDIVLPARLGPAALSARAREVSVAGLNVCRCQRWRGSGSWMRATRRTARRIVP